MLVDMVMVRVCTLVMMGIIVLLQVLEQNPRASTAARALRPAPPKAGRLLWMLWRYAAGALATAAVATTPVPAVIHFRISHRLSHNRFTTDDRPVSGPLAKRCIVQVEMI